jgi:hypothetical protein
LKLYDLIVQQPCPELPLKYSKYLSPLYKYVCNNWKKNDEKKSTAKTFSFLITIIIGIFSIDEIIFEEEENRFNRFEEDGAKTINSTKEKKWIKKIK